MGGILACGRWRKLANGDGTSKWQRFYSPVFNNAPNSGGTSGVSVNTPDDAFGGGVAGGLKHLGAGIGDAGGEL